MSLASRLGRRPAPGSSAFGEAGAPPSARRLSTRVAFQTTLIVAAAYIAIAIAAGIFVTTSLTGQIDANLQNALNRVPGQAPSGGFEVPKPDRPYNAPLLVWTIQTNGTVNSTTAAGAALPAEYQHVTTATTVTIDGVQIRIAGAERGADYVVVGQSMDNVTQTQTTLVAAEAGIGAALLIAVFFGAVAIGRSVASPIEAAHRRQLEFTADASHELRTPLSVIEAQTSLALAKERPIEWYQTAFQRVEGESRRIRKLVDDMLWLARFDATQGRPDAEPVDLNVLAAATVDRFRVVAEARRLSIAVQADAESGIVTVPPEWLDRLLGVLLDNACRYSPEGGRIDVSITEDARRIRLAVDDAGPGIRVEERERIFDRFHRATQTPGGSGLGLAIADSIVRATGGRWQIGESAAAGASMSVSWPRTTPGAGA